jgi:hypothetical protein
VQHKGCQMKRSKKFVFKSFVPWIPSYISRPGAHYCHRCIRLQRPFDDPPLLLQRTSSSLRFPLNDGSFSSVHLFSKWTPPEVPTKGHLPHLHTLRRHVTDRTLTGQVLCQMLCQMVNSSHLLAVPTFAGPLSLSATSFVNIS